MFRRTLTLTILVVSMLISPFASLADEGMWLPDTIDKLPLSQLKKMGFELKPEDVYSADKPSLKDAIVQISIGGTGSFVSPEGLILTNHHVALAAVTRASTPQNDYISNGFLAPSRDKEISATGYSISITQEYKDVTSEVIEAVKPEMSDADRTRAISARQQEIARTALAGREKEGIRTQVVEATSGLQYFLYTYLTLRDVRLVYAPPKSIGYFGGDPDNFEWPRHCGDFAFLRAYVAPDGKPATFSKDNVPFKPKKFLTINVSGIKEGDFSMVMGYPGSTFRYRESYSVDYRQRIQLPNQIDAIRRQVEVLTKLSEKNPELGIRLSEQIFGLNNALKNFEGTVLGLKRMDLVAKKREQEAAFTKWVEAAPDRKAKYGEILPQIAELYRDLNSFGSKQSVLNNITNAGDLVSALVFAYNRALDRDKPADQRTPQFSDAALQRITAQLSQAWQERETESEIGTLAAALNSSRGLPADQKLSFVDKQFETAPDGKREDAVADYARKIIAGSRFNSFDELKKLFDATATDIRNTDDPLLKLAVFAVDELEPLNERVTKFNNSITNLRPQLIRGMLEMKNGPYYPDANFTLRFTYGEVKGYKPRDAVTYDYQTSLSGVIAKDTGEDPFVVPDGLKELHAKRDFGNYIEPRLKDVPVAFLTTNDITGGNSGSPVMNGRGEIIGLAFDGNFEGLGGDYAFDPASNRTISVDIRYVLFLTEKFAGAGYLFNEMQIKRGKSMVAGKQ